MHLLKTQHSQPVVAILIGEMFDEWLDGLRISLESFSTLTMGSWVFNYVEALQASGVQSVIVCISTRVATITRLTHSPTGARLVIIPPPRVYRLFHRILQMLCCSHACSRWFGRALSLLRNTLRFLFSYLSTPATTIFRELHREGCTSLLVQEYESVRFDLCVIIGRLQRVSVFGTFQGGQPQNFLLSPLRRFAIRHCDGLLIPAVGEAQRVTQAYGLSAEQLAMVYSPVDTRVFYPGPKEEARRALGLPLTAKVAMYHGSIDLSYKGLDVLLNAWNQISHLRADEDIRLIIIGTGSDAARFSQMICERQFKGITWINEWTSDRDLIRQYLSASDVYVFPSRGDACPNSVIEAMACGLPIVASSINGIPDLLENGRHSCGILVPSDNAGAVVQAVNDLFLNPTRGRAFGCHALSRVKEDFSIDGIGKQLKSTLLNRTEQGTTEVMAEVH